MSRRDILLDAISEAGRLHQDAHSREQVEAQGGGVDVFGAILQLSITLLFRPLDKLLGAFVSRPAAGIIITNERSLAIQRFTAAHELGHERLGHDGSLDDESILNRSASRTVPYTTVEAAADAFAAGFLMPVWLMETHAKRQGWNPDSFRDPINVYQLSLRIGASYEATCRALARCHVITGGALDSHLAVAPKKIKQHLLRDSHLENWYPDVWVLTERDQGTRLEGGPNDVFLVRLKEHSGGGYLWNADQLKDAGFTIVSDKRSIADHSQSVGGEVERVLVAASHFEGAGHLELKEARPWEKQGISEFKVSYDLFGKESGLPRAVRNKVTAA